jgi:CheY-like chemotaxis protein/two-component sensor histidine kinase
LDVIERNVRLQTRMIDDLLDMSRIVSGKVRLEVQPIDPAEVIRAAMATLQPAAEARGIEVSLDLRADAGRVRGDSNRLQQVVWNLLSNAIKFSAPGGRVSVLLEAREGLVEISVQDEGQGISADFLPHVFDRFRQADSSMSRRHGGLGLGLSIVRQLVELHGGTVRAASDGEGRGATFTISLPQMATWAGEVPGPVRGAGSLEGDATALAGVRVLLVEDDPDSRDLLARILQLNGAGVAVATSAEEALDTVAGGAFDLLISDIGMPGVDGYELLRRLRSRPAEEGGTLPAIALTAFARTEDRTRALRSGYQMHVAKPVEPAELVAAVASLSARGGAGVLPRGGPELPG